jgi:hypothetical protein
VNGRPAGSLVNEANKILPEFNKFGAASAAPAVNDGAKRQRTINGPQELPITVVDESTGANTRHPSPWLKSKL